MLRQINLNCGTYILLLYTKIIFTPGLQLHVGHCSRWGGGVGGFWGGGKQLIDCILGGGTVYVIIIL